MLLTVKKFFCRVSDCPRKIFVERLPDLVAVSSRLTLRLRSAVQEVSLARLSAKAVNAWQANWGCLSLMPRSSGRSI